MARDMLWVDGVSPETKKQLQEAAKALYGQANASLMVRALIANHFAKNAPIPVPLSSEEASETGRVEIRLPRTVLKRIDELAEARWFARADIPADHSGISLTGEMIERFRAGDFQGSTAQCTANA